MWANDSKTLFYVRLDDHHRPLLVYRHVVGTPVEDDVLVYAEKDIGFYVAISSTQSAKFVLIDAHDHQTSEARTHRRRRAARSRRASSSRARSATSIRSSITAIS